MSLSDTRQPPIVSASSSSSPSSMITGTKPREPAGPWRRFFARMLDLSWLSLVFTFGIVLAGMTIPWFAMWILKPWSLVFSSLVILMPLTLFAEAVIFNLFGTTPAKAFLGVHVVTLERLRPTLKQYLRRQAALYWYGLGAGIPFIWLVFCLRQKNNLADHAPTDYDAGKFLVEQGNFGSLRQNASMTTAIVLFFAISVGGQWSLSRFIHSTLDYQLGIQWMNPVTGQVARITPGWIARDVHNHQNKPVFLFLNPNTGMLVIFATENLPVSETLNDYAANLAFAIQESVIVDGTFHGTNIDGLECVAAQGHRASVQRLQASITVCKVDDFVWRFVAFEKLDVPLDPTKVDNLQQALFRTAILSST